MTRRPRKPAPPTADQLLHLVDRADAGKLLPAEAALLRDGIKRLAASLAGHGSVVHRLTADLWTEQRRSAELARTLSKLVTENAVGIELIAVSDERARYRAAWQSARSRAAEQNEQAAMYHRRWQASMRRRATERAERDALAAAVQRVRDVFAFGEQAIATVGPDAGSVAALVLQRLRLAVDGLGDPEHCNRCHGNEDGPCHEPEHVNGPADDSCCPGCRTPAVVETAVPDAYERDADGASWRTTAPEQPQVCRRCLCPAGAPQQCEHCNCCDVPAR